MSPARGLFAACLVLLLVLSGRPGPAEAQTSVPVRVGSHAGHDRVVFDWTRPVGYELEQEGRDLVIRFGTDGRLRGRPVGLSRLKRIETVEMIAREPLTVRIVTRRSNPAIRTLVVDGTKVVIDVTDAPRPEPPAATGPPTAIAGSAPAPAGTAAPAGAGPTAQAPEQPPAEAPGGGRSDPGTMAPPEPDQVRAPEADAGAAEGDAATDTAAAETAEGDAAPADGPDLPDLVIRLEGTGPSALAAFARGRVLWLVHTGAVGRLPPALGGEAAGQLASPGAMPVAGGLAHRLTFPDAVPASFRVTRDGLAWILTPGDGGTAAAVVVGETAPRAIEVTPVPGAEPPITVEDPLTGEQLEVVAAAEPGGRIATRRRFLEATLLATAQGVVVIAEADGVTVAVDGATVRIGAPEGVEAAPIETALPEGEPMGPAAPTPEVLGLGDWASDPGAFAGRAAELEAAAAAAAEAEIVARLEQDAAAEQRARARRVPPLIDLARLHLAQGLGPEAVGWLQLAASLVPEVAGTRDHQLLSGVAAIMAGRAAEGLALLEAAGLEDVAEVRLWQAVALTRLERADEARALIGGTGGLLLGYPAPVLATAGPAIAAAAISDRTKDLEDAGRLIDEMESRLATQPAALAALDFLRARVAAAGGNVEGAVERLRGIAATGEPYWRARATLALADLATTTGRVPLPEVAEMLEGVRYAWRGDGLELELLDALAETQMALGTAEGYRAGWAGLRDAIALAPQVAPGAGWDERLTERLTDSFKQLFLEGGAYRLAPDEGVQLFNDFKELVPVGAEGDQAERTLARLLVRLDLLDEAASRLEPQVRSRLSCPQRAEVGAWVAALRLIDGKPEPARAILDQSDCPDPGQALATKRLLLEARARADAGDAVGALAALKDEGGIDADKLRVDIGRRTGDWTLAADALNRLIGPPAGRLEPPVRALVLARASALSLAGDSYGLAQLRSAFGPAMTREAGASLREAEAFDLLTRPAGAVPDLDVERIRSRIAEADIFRDFLDNLGSDAGDEPPPVPGAESPPVPQGESAPTTAAAAEPEPEPPEGG